MPDTFEEMHCTAMPNGRLPQDVYVHGSVANPQALTIEVLTVELYLNHSHDPP